MVSHFVGSILIGGGIALVAFPFITGRDLWQEFPFVIAGVFITLAGLFFCSLGREERNGT